MGNRDETKRLIFEEPTSAKVTFKAAKSLLENEGFKYTKGSGSRRKFIHEKTKVVVFLHEPHGKELCKDAVSDIRDALKKVGVKPDAP
jgi:predicted RNA binding protein YcfA (HicA-like mRNA interferase family)